MGGIDLIISHAGDFNVTNVTPYPAVVLTDNYSYEQEQLRPSGLESKNAGVRQTTQCPRGVLS